jgi:hypothetical protein
MPPQADLDDVIDEMIERAPLCLLVGRPDDPDIIGPFATYEEVTAFVAAFPERCRRAELRVMISPEIERLSILREEEIAAIKHRADLAAHRALESLMRDVLRDD